MGYAHSEQVNQVVRPWGFDLARNQESLEVLFGALLSVKAASVIVGRQANAQLSLRHIEITLGFLDPLSD
jgi:hypothetical protein